MYIHERKEWPGFEWDRSRLVDLLAEVRQLQGRLLGRMEGFGFQLREEATLQTLTQDVVKTSEIEGEKLDVETVRSSIARRMGLDIGAFPLPGTRGQGCPSSFGCGFAALRPARFDKRPRA